MKPIARALMVALTAMAVSAPAFADRDYRDKHGYRERPYDKHRHYDHRAYRGQRYTYQGHWRSWGDWDRYYRERPWLRRDGRYYREDGHLMFRFCDPGGGGCFFFSIGR